MFHSYLSDHDALAAWLAERFGVEGTAMVNKDGPGLDRIRAIFSPYISALKTKKIVTIAGTNGKGETAYQLEQLLLKDAKKVALWTSPHLVSVTERMRFNGHEISAQECQQIFLELEGKGESLSYYEFLFLCFIKYCTHHEFDVLILEVGLGGRLDAVNLIDADVSAVCSIGRDHQAILGFKLEEILYEKLGVSRPEKPCVSALESKFLRSKTKDWCESHNVHWIDAFERGDLCATDAYPRRNQVVAHMLKSLVQEQFDSFDAKAIKNQNESFPGRREVMTLGALRFIFIGAHNVDGFRHMTQFWCEKGHPDEVWCSFSARPLRDLKACVALLAKLPKKIRHVLTPFEHPRAQSAESLQQLAATMDGRIEFEANWKELLLSDNKSARTIAIVGSYYFVGAVMRELLLRGSKRA